MEVSSCSLFSITSHNLLSIGYHMLGPVVLLLYDATVADDHVRDHEPVAYRIRSGHLERGDSRRSAALFGTPASDARERRDSASDYVKRALDIIIAAVFAVLLAPLMIVIALLIRLDSPGPILFRQQRAGRGGRPFTMYKFRTMCADADAAKHSLRHLNLTGDPRLFKIPNDPRVTRTGSLLRKISVDELPQLWNVLRGDMSMVGPRPFFVEDLETYATHHFRRLEVRPGLTGLWQVNGRSIVRDFEEVIRLDTSYVDNRSIWLDTQILLRTIPTVLRRNGAY
jgi:exopolysaccharide biosynthesis polyprenyl glycosylphosphotransferase